MRTPESKDTSKPYDSSAALNPKLATHFRQFRASFGFAALERTSESKDTSSSMILVPLWTRSPGSDSRQLRCGLRVRGTSACLAVLARRRDGAGVAGGIEVGVESFADAREQHGFVPAEFAGVDMRDLPRGRREQQPPRRGIVEAAAQREREALPDHGGAHHLDAVFIARGWRDRKGVVGFFAHDLTDN